MKHIKTFENFLNESLSEKKEEKFRIARIVDGRIKEMIEGTVEQIRQRFSAAIDNQSARNPKFKGDNPKNIEELIELLNQAQEFAEKTQKPKTVFELQESANEGNDLSYWKDYADGSSQSPKWYSNDAKNPSAVNKLVDAVVNHELDELDDKDADIDPSDMKALTDLAMKYFKKFGSINGHIVSAMLFQEAKESFENK